MRPPVIILLLLIALGGCRSLPPGKPIGELTTHEAAGRAVFAANCAKCHNAYSMQALHGPSMYGVFRKQFLPSGAPARDDRVLQVVLRGRNLMPAAGQDLDQQQLHDLLEYLHTL